jgi:hypothetical protein
MPVVMQELAVEGQHRRRAGPKIVVQGLGNWLRPTHLADAGAGFVIHPVDIAGLPEAALPHVLQRLLEARVSRIAGDLDNPLVLLGGLHYLAAFEDVVGSRLLHEYVLPGLARPDGHERVPVVWGGEGDRVDILVFEQLASIGVALDGLVVALEFLDMLRCTHGSHKR